MLVFVWSDGEVVCMNMWEEREGNRLGHVRALVCACGALT